MKELLKECLDEGFAMIDATSFNERCHTALLALRREFSDVEFVLNSNDRKDEVVFNGFSKDRKNLFYVKLKYYHHSPEMEETLIIRSMNRC
jgi:hypothetical protein